MRRLFLPLLFLAFIPASAAAFSASSTNFFVRQFISAIGGSPVGIYSTSTSFKLISSSGEALGISTSTTFGLRSGFLNGLTKGVKPTYTLIRYHFRFDDGSETTATSRTSGTENTTVSNINEGSTLRLRLNISNEGGTRSSYSAQTFRIEYGEKSTTCAAIGAWTQVGAGGSPHWSMSDSANLTNAANTTNVAVSTGGVSDTNATFLVANGGVRDTGSDTGALLISSDTFVELEYSMVANAAATDGGTYCFRVTNAGSTTNFSYSVYPEATITSASLTFSVDSNTQTLPGLTPGTLVATTSILTAKTGNSSGFTISTIRDTVLATMSRSGESSVVIPDKSPDWIAPGLTSNPGNATASTTQTQTLQFRIRSSGTDAANYASAWWGSADTTANALFAGIPSTTQVIVNRASAAVATTTAYVLYNLDVPQTQKTGTYTGSITYTAVANP